MESQDFERAGLRPLTRPQLPIRTGRSGLCMLGCVRVICRRFHMWYALLGVGILPICARGWRKRAPGGIGNSCDRDLLVACGVRNARGCGLQLRRNCCIFWHASWRVCRQRGLGMRTVQVR